MGVTQLGFLMLLEKQFLVLILRHLLQKPSWRKLSIQHKRNEKSIPHDNFTSQALRDAGLQIN